MDLHPYVETIQRQLEAAADVAGDDARALADRLIGPLDAAMRLALQDALAVAVEEITCELAPASVELRLRGRDLEFMVTAPAELPETDSSPGPGVDTAGWAGAGSHPGDGEDGGMSRINLRMPDHLKARIDLAADAEQLSVNAWLLRAAGAALERSGGRRQERHTPHGPQRLTGWAR